MLAGDPFSYILTCMVIYVLRSNKDIDGIYRIGKSKKFKTIKIQHYSSHPDDMEIEYILETTDIDSVKECIHMALKERQYKRRKEFFEADIDLIKELLDDCDNQIFRGKYLIKKFTPLKILNETNKHIGK